MRGVAEPVKAEATRIASLAIGSITEHSCAKQRCDGRLRRTGSGAQVDTEKFVWEMKAVSGVSDGEFSVAAVDVVAGKLGVIAKIFTVRSTISAIAIGPAEPRNSNAISDFELRIADCGLRIGPGADLIDATDNLMTKNQWQLRIGEFAINNVQIGPANGAGVDANKQFSPARPSFRDIAHRAAREPRGDIG